MHDRMASLERRLEATEASVKIPEISHGSSGGGDEGGGGRGFTVGEAVQANGEVGIASVLYTSSVVFNSVLYCSSGGV